MILLIFTTLLIFTYAYNFFVNYHILVVFLSITPFISIPFFKNTPNSYIYLIILLYWGFSYYLIASLLCNVYLSYLSLTTFFIAKLFNSLSLLNLLMY